MHKFFAKPHKLGKKVLFLPQCHSTNEIALSLVNNGHGTEGTTILTDDQTKGKGQRGNLWHSQAGKNLTFSFILQPTFIPLVAQFDLHLMVSLAVYDTLAQILDDRLTIKWPNDLYYNNQKIGGILIENSVRGTQIAHSVVGIGINVNQDTFDPPLNATSLKIIMEKEHSIDDLAETILLHTEKYYDLIREPKHTLRQSYEKHLYQIHQLKRYQADGEVFSGEIRGVSPHGQLRIEQQGNYRLFHFKEVSFL
ncbi:biotin--[acetyl-CoA-carboxylase] ligase [Reichenbachiella sp. 5M10]|uniref:biotin--[acetyl-CoA-carboxylase] ligase n=1 Tax=Reichenbachiella sp. 5M10 TaxID=1889772 RepID=UPI000C352145|nr:biotin--[acetyl-CoA-carboxylase] ligase [Reichenbachiella sp. 5M10]PIB36512.1 biotin--[acetyl-CoA-carboxylase] ligase [Reichenbachiella sp. 5M10]